eukprot:292631_1
MDCQLLLKLGDKVKLKDSGIGIVKYIGIPHFSEQELIGIDLDQWNVNGHSGKGYFKTSPGRGTFAGREDIVESTAHLNFTKSYLIVFGYCHSIYSYNIPSDIMQTILSAYFVRHYEMQNVVILTNTATTIRGEIDKINPDSMDIALYKNWTDKEYKKPKNTKTDSLKILMPIEPLITFNKDITIEQNETQILYSNQKYKFNSLTLKSNSCLLCDFPFDVIETNAGGCIDIEIENNLVMESNSKISANGMGYAQGLRAETYQGDSYNGHGKSGKTANDGGGGGARRSSTRNWDPGAGAGGGGYGTKGKDGYECHSNQRMEVYGIGGEIYGDEKLDRLFLGSGGGSCYGGRGGGIIHIKCKGDIVLAKDSLICANGDDSTAWNGGGGSGGSVKIEGNNIKIYDKSCITVSGGKGGVKQTRYDISCGGNGGYGRILVSGKECGTILIFPDNIVGIEQNVVVEKDTNDDVPTYSLFDDSSSDD